MGISDALQADVGSLQQAIGMVLLRNTVHQDSLSVAMLMQGMQTANAKIMENSVAPHLGGNIDIRV